MSVKRYLFYISQNYSFAILRPVQKLIIERGGEVAWFAEGASVTINYFDKNERVLNNVDEINTFSPMAILYPANIAPTFLPGINVAVFHGFDAGKLDRKGNNDHYKVRHCFDLYCTQGPSSTREFERLQSIHQSFNVKETGWCALDTLFTKKNADKKGNKPTVLLCSTFSSRLSCASDIFETVKKLSKTGRWHWLVQFHPKMDKKIVQQYKAIQSEHLTFIETDDVNPLLQQADVMVCDTSSVLMMFLLLNKPVVTYKNISPGDFLIDIDSADLLEKSIARALSRPDELMTNIQHFIDENHPYQDGQSSQRLLAAIDEKIAQGNTKNKKSFDLIRQYKMRKKLNYWKFW
ncbi:MAG: CDP-glycerol glycerophosphotransferase family protein [Colwellia sp.]|nr:CDP-glycerol glycerophosphotransferase family protein [Colwellia sp.]